ncbi:hypothetical protein ACLB2K_054819 [Fragaria x ananassa]
MSLLSPPYGTGEHRRGRASTLTDSSSFPDLFPSPASPPNFSFLARSPKTSNKVNPAGKLELSGLTGDEKRSRKLLESTGVEVRPRRRRTVANGGKSAPGPSPAAATGFVANAVTDTSRSFRLLFLNLLYGRPRTVDLQGLEVHRQQDSFAEDLLGRSIILGSSNGLICLQETMFDGSWRTVEDFKFVNLNGQGCFVNGALHWLDSECNSTRIISFDLAKEKCEQLCRIVCGRPMFRIGIGSIRNCLCALLHLQYCQIYANGNMADE